MSQEVENGLACGLAFSWLCKTGKNCQMSQTAEMKVTKLRENNCQEKSGEYRSKVKVERTKLGQTHRHHYRTRCEVLSKSSPIVKWNLLPGKRLVAITSLPTPPAALGASLHALIRSSLTTKLGERSEVNCLKFRYTHKTYFPRIRHQC